MLKIGDLLGGKYRILSVVGRGGMSTVYLARNERANKNWAVKEVRKSGVNQDQVVEQSLLTEVEIMKHLNNPHLPSIIDVIDIDDTFVIVMDFVEGNSLEKVLEHGSVSEIQVIDLAKQLCDVLLYLHSCNPPIIYRDMKPSNVVLRPDGVVMLLDFGTAKEYKYDESGDATTCLGTRGYAAPEQYGGHGRTDARTDIYCLGATLYHLVTGKHPSSEPYMKPVRKINPKLSEGLEKIIQKCTRQNPEERYQSCAELKFDLDHVEEIGRKAQRKRNRNLGLFFGSVLMAVFGIAGMTGFKIAVSDETRSSYDYYISQGDAVAEDDKEQELSEKTEIYKQAIQVEPARSEAYRNLLDTIIQDNRIDIKEIQAMQTLLGQMLEGNPAQNYFQKRNEKEFDEFAYDLGVNYYLYCTDNGKSLSLEWLNYAADSTTLSKEKRGTAESLRTIAKSHGELTKKVNSEYTYTEYWTDLNGLVQDDLVTNTGYYIALGIYRYTAGEIKSQINKFKAQGGIEKAEIEQLLDRIEQGTAQIETDNNLDEEDQKLVEEIRNQVKGARDMTAMAYGA